MQWSAAQYVKFAGERTRAARDLLAAVPLTDPARLVDLGCGPGNSTELLIDRDPAAKVSGIDNDPNMLKAARAALAVGIIRASGAEVRTTATAAIETSLEVDTLRNGGLMPTILSRILAGRASS